MIAFAVVEGTVEVILLKGHRLGSSSIETSTLQDVLAGRYIRSLGT